MTPTRKTRLGLFALVAIGTLAVGGLRAQEPGLGKKIGEKLDEAGTSIRREAGRAGDAIRDQFQKAKASINAMGVEGRVYGRLHWDKALEGATIDVHAERDGTVTLTGGVVGELAKAKAVQLTTETVGVVRVVDQLEIPTKAP